MPPEHASQVRRRERQSVAAFDTVAGKQSRNLLPGQTAFAQVGEQSMVFPQQPLERNRSRRTMKVRGHHRYDLLNILLHAKSMSRIPIGHKAPIQNETLRVNLKHHRKTQIESTTPVHLRTTPAWQELFFVLARWSVAVISPASSRGSMTAGLNGKSAGSVPTTVSHARCLHRFGFSKSSDARPVAITSFLPRHSVEVVCSGYLDQ
ncbi:MAG: hypothetical protein AB7V13_08265 [Pseudorhodoplanes sp.]